MAGVSESNGEQMAQVSQPNEESAPELVGPNQQAAPGGAEGAGPGQAPGVELPGGLNEASRAIQEKQERDYIRYVKAYRDYHEHAETYRDWVVGGVRIRSRETACQQCSDAGTKVYDADSLPKLPLTGCTGDGDGYCTCTYVVALRRASATALATEVTPPPASSAPSAVPGLCPSCGAVLTPSASACRVCGAPNPAVLAMSLTPERPGAPRSGVSDLPPGRNRWLRTLLGGRQGAQAPEALPLPEGSPIAPGPAPSEPLVPQGPGARGRRRQPLPMLLPLNRAAYRLTRRWHRKTITISADMGTIRVVVFQGRDVVAWGSTRPGEEATATEQEPVSPEKRNMAALLELLDELHVPRERPAQGVLSYAVRLRKALEPLGFRRTQVVMDFPLYDTLVRHLQLPRVSRSYLEPMIISEVVDSIPFARSEVDIAWHTRRLGAMQAVYAVAVPRDRLDRQVALLKEAGIPPMAGYARAEALAFASGVADGILVHLEPSHASVVLVQGSLPRVVHQVAFASGEQTDQARAELLARAVDQVSGYYHTLGAGEESWAWPVVLTGQFTEPLALALRDLSHRRTVTFVPELGWPDGFRPEDYAPNLGLFLAYEARPRDESRMVKHPWVPLSLLAERHLPRMVPVTPVAVFITLMLLWLHPFDVGGHVNAKLVATSSLAGQIDVLKTRVQQHRTNQTQEKAIQKEIQDLTQQSKALQLHLDELAISMDTLLARLETMSATAMPAGVALNSLVQRADGFTLVGTAYSYDQVLAYAANLRDSGLFSDARVLKMDGREKPEDPLAASVSFQLEAMVPVTAKETADK
ncbi:MAG TPA: PilN domain-containing protein [Dehalococcoidia bacterium]|nr:PilN domain-containing protein [Dehalococcoidia bacterium]